MFYLRLDKVRTLNNKEMPRKTEPRLMIFVTFLVLPFLSTCQNYANNLGSLKFSRIEFAEIEAAMIYQNDLPYGFIQSTVLSEDGTSSVESLENKIDLSRLFNLKHLELSKQVELIQFFDNIILDSIQSRANCYEPRHAILFYDAQDSIECFIEICFHCSRLGFVSRQAINVEINSQDFEQLKQFFLRENYNIID